MSVVRSIRLSKETDAVLRNEARDRGLSYNQLVATVLKRYSEWDRFTEKMGYVSNSTILYRQLIDLIPEENVQELGASAGRMIKEALLILYKKTDLASLLQYMSLVTKYGWGSSVRYDQRMDKNQVVLTIHHLFGKKWSLAFCRQMQEIVREVAGAEPHTVTTENTVTITFPTGTKRSANNFAQNDMPLVDPQLVPR